MATSDKFQLWLKIRLGHLAVIESTVTDVQVLPEDVRIEVKRAGRWVHAKESELRG